MLHIECIEWRYSGEYGKGRHRLVRVDVGRDRSITFTHVHVVSFYGVL